MVLFETLLVNLKLKYVAIVLISLLFFLLFSHKSHLSLNTCYRFPIFNESYQSMHILPPLKSSRNPILLRREWPGRLDKFELPVDEMMREKVSSTVKTMKTLPSLPIQASIHIDGEVDKLMVVKIGDQNTHLALMKNGTLLFFTTDPSVPIWRVQLVKNPEDKMNASLYLSEAALFPAPALCLRKDHTSCGVVFAAFEGAFVQFVEPGSYSFLALHFTVVAVHLFDGQELWRSSSNQSEKIYLSPSGQTDSLPVRDTLDHWKLRLLREVQDVEHVQERHWTDYRRDLLNYLPHSCRDATQLQLGRISREPVANEEASIRDLQSSNQSTPSPTLKEVDAQSNVLIAKHRSGLHALDLRSGKVKAFLPWKCADRELANLYFASHMHMFGWGEAAPQELVVTSFLSQEDGRPTGVQCTLGMFSLEGDLTSSGSSVESSLAQVPHHSVQDLCQPPSYLDYPRLPDKYWLEHKMKMVSPLLVPRCSYPSGLHGMLYHLMGKVHAPEQKWDILVLTSDGILTSVNENALVNWKTASQVSWIQQARHFQMKMTAEASLDELSRLYQAFKPTLNRIDLYSPNHPTVQVVLATGWNSLSLIDPIDGELLATHSLPGPPVDKPLVYREHWIIVPCERTVVMFQVHRAKTWSHHMLLWLTVGLVFLLLSWFCDPNNEWYSEMIS